MRWLLKDSDRRFIRNNYLKIPDWYLAKFLNLPLHKIKLIRWEEGLLKPQSNQHTGSFSLEVREPIPNKEKEDDFKQFIFLLSLKHNKEKVLCEQPIYFDKSEGQATHFQQKDAA